MNKDFNEDWIEQVDTLSREECETIEDELLACKFPWWTKSPAWIGCVTIVYQNGSM